jgi:hypothetical protein
MWLPDTNSAWFRAEAHRQSLVVAMSAAEREDQEFADSISNRADD